MQTCIIYNWPQGGSVLLTKVRMLMALNPQLCDSVSEM